MAPELLDGQVYSKAVDIWSAGIIMFMLFNKGEHPYFSSGDTEETMRKRLKNMPKTNLNMSSKQKSLFQKLISFEPHHRYTAH
jgi:calcium/calmodulin-dependent protein kinase I/SNF-related kinase